MFHCRFIPSFSLCHTALVERTLLNNQQLVDGVREESVVVQGNIYLLGEEAGWHASLEWRRVENIILQPGCWPQNLNSPTSQMCELSYLPLDISAFLPMKWSW